MQSFSKQGTVLLNIAQIETQGDKKEAKSSITVQNAIKGTNFNYAYFFHFEIW